MLYHGNLYSHVLYRQAIPASEPLTVDFLLWKPSSQTLTVILIAVFTTIISYQFTSVVFDLLLGIKERNLCTLSCFHTLILCEDPSFGKVAAAIQGKSQNRDPTRATGSRIPYRAVALLLLLLSVFSFLDVVFIFLTLEKDETITFSEADFGPFAFGANPELSTVQLLLSSFSCQTYQVNLPVGAERLADFSKCTEIATGTSIASGTTQSISLLSNDKSEVFLKIGGEKFTTATSGTYIRSGGKLYRVKLDLNVEMAEAIVANAKAFIENTCAFPDSRMRNGTDEDLNRIETAVEGNLVSLSTNLTCLDLSEFERIAGLFELVSPLTLIGSKHFYVATVTVPSSEQDKPRFFVGDDLPLLGIRNTNIRFLTLSVLAGTSILVRVVVGLLTRNDVHEGVEAVVAQRLGLFSGYNLLRCGREVEYCEAGKKDEWVEGERASV